MPYTAKQVSDLQAERTGDPLTLGYSAMTDAQFLSSITTENRNRNRTSMTGSEVLNAVDGPEYSGLTDVKKDSFWGLLGIGDLDPFGVEASVMQDIFGASQTITDLQAARVEQISRATEIGLPAPVLVDVARTV